jgi:hypothetical protein
VERGRSPPVPQRGEAESRHVFPRPIVQALVWWSGLAQSMIRGRLEVKDGCVRPPLWLGCVTNARSQSMTAARFEAPRGRTPGPVGREAAEGLPPEDAGEARLSSSERSERVHTAGPGRRGSLRIIPGQKCSVRPFPAPSQRPTALRVRGPSGAHRAGTRTRPSTRAQRATGFERRAPRRTEPLDSHQAAPTGARLMDPLASLAGGHAGFARRPPTGALRPLRGLRVPEFGRAAGRTARPSLIATGNWRATKLPRRPHAPVLQFQPP